jgi:hypothetical protein
MTNHFPAATTNLDQPSPNNSVPDGGPNLSTDIVKEPTPDVQAKLNSENGGDMSDKTPHLKARHESESLDTERSSSTKPDKDRTSLSSLDGRATGPRTPTRPSRRPGENRNTSGPFENLPISSLYAELAQKPLPEELRIELKLEEGATFGDAVGAALFAAAIKGSVPAAHELRESVEGKANERRNPAAAGPITIHVEYEPPLSKMMPKDSADKPNDRADTPNE